MGDPDAITVLILSVRLKWRGDLFAPAAGVTAQGRLFVGEEYLLVENEIDLAGSVFLFAAAGIRAKKYQVSANELLKKLFFNTKTAAPNKFDGDFRIKKLRLSRAEVIR